MKSSEYKTIISLNKNILNTILDFFLLRDELYIPANKVDYTIVIFIRRPLLEIHHIPNTSNKPQQIYTNKETKFFSDIYSLR